MLDVLEMKPERAGLRWSGRRERRDSEYLGRRMLRLEVAVRKLVEMGEGEEDAEGWKEADDAEGDGSQEEKEKKGCCSEQRVLIPLEQDGLQDLQYPTMKTALPADCTA